MPFIVVIWHFWTFQGLDCRALLCLHEDLDCVLFCAKAQISGMFNLQQFLPLRIEVCKNQDLQHGQKQRLMANQLKAGGKNRGKIGGIFLL